MIDFAIKKKIMTIGSLKGQTVYEGADRLLCVSQVSTEDNDRDGGKPHRA